MQLPICAFFAWLAITIFSLLHKRLSTLHFVFLYFVILIISLTTFTIFDINVHTVTISKTPTISFSTLICRIVTIPVLVIVAVNALQFTEERKPQWITAIATWLGLTMFDWALYFLKVITYHHSFWWHARGTFVTYFGFIVISWCLLWIFKKCARKNVRPT